MVTVISCTISYAIVSINRCPCLSGSLACSGSSHEVVPVGVLLVSKLGVFTVLACVIAGNSKSVCPTVVGVGFASVRIGCVWIISVIVVIVVVVIVVAVLLLAQHKVLERRDVCHCCPELFGQV